ncbi:MAG: metallophosphoesterase [Bacteroidales bacterium]|nr:metallophosphoesterase [Bacteroidales bacterium]
MVTIIEIIANLIIIALMMVFIGLLALSISAIARLFGADFKSFFIKGLWFTLLAPALWCYGTLIERNQCQIKNIEITSDKIPQSFNDYKIIQISDLHLHSFKNRAKTLEKFVDVINNQNADIVVFTGDLVSYGPWELDGLDTILSKIKAKDGVYSVLGNHDYSAYSNFPDSTQWKYVEELKDRQFKIGWNLLLDENVSLIRGNDTISLIGVENISTHRAFLSFGNLQNAMNDADGDYKILLSHDPTHWELEVKDIEEIDLMLSGHTHAMQFTILGWTPSSFIFNEVAGLFKHNNQYLYVNIGLGETVMKSRIGAKPEITSIVIGTSEF